MLNRAFIATDLLLQDYGSASVSGFRPDLGNLGLGPLDDGRLVKDLCHTRVRGHSLCPPDKIGRLLLDRLEQTCGIHTVLGQRKKANRKRPSQDLSLQSAPTQKREKTDNKGETNLG